MTINTNPTPWIIRHSSIVNGWIAFSALPIIGMISGIFLDRVLCKTLENCSDPSHNAELTSLQTRRILDMQKNLLDHFIIRESLHMLILAGIIFALMITSSFLNPLTWLLILGALSGCALTSYLLKEYKKQVVKIEVNIISLLMNQYPSTWPVQNLPSCV